MWLPWLIVLALAAALFLAAVVTARWWGPALGMLYRDAVDSIDIGLTRFKKQIEEVAENESQE